MSEIPTYPYEKEDDPKAQLVALGERVALLEAALTDNINAYQLRVAELEAERDDALRLAYLGDHRFPDLTYKARLEETASDLTTARGEAAAMRAVLQEVLTDIHGGDDPYAPPRDDEAILRGIEATVEAALAPGAGSALLERFRLAEAVVEAAKALQERSYGIGDDLCEALREYDAAAKPASTHCQYCNASIGSGNNCCAACADESGP